MDEYHIIPENDLRDHATIRECWCRPVRDLEWPQVWLHNSMDRREEYENGRPLA